MSDHRLLPAVEEDNNFQSTFFEWLHVEAIQKSTKLLKTSCLMLFRPFRFFSEAFFELKRSKEIECWIDKPWNKHKKKKLLVITPLVGLLDLNFFNWAWIRSSGERKGTASVFTVTGSDDVKFI